jgi:hypothetical protein
MSEDTPIEVLTVPTKEMVGEMPDHNLVFELIEMNIRASIALFDEFIVLRKYDDDYSWYQRQLLMNAMTRLNNRLMVVNGISLIDNFEEVEKRNLKTLDSIIKWMEDKNAREAKRDTTNRE